MRTPEFPRRVLGIYARTVRTYAERAPALLALGAVVFVPLGLLESVSLDVDFDGAGFGSGLLALAILATAAAVTATGVVGEVFYSGAVAIFLTHSEGGKEPSLRDVARHISYRRLIVVDVLFVLLVVAGFALLVVPGVLAFTWFVLAGTVVELEGRGVRGAFARSRALAKGRFLTVLTVLGVLQVLEETLVEGAATAGEALLGHGLLADWLLESAANLALAPVYAVASVLLALELIAEKDGVAPQIDSEISRS